MTRPGYPFPPLPTSLEPDDLARSIGGRLGDAWDEVQARRQAVLTSANALRRDLVLRSLDELAASVRAFQASVLVEAKDYAQRTLPSVYGGGAAEAGLRVSSAEPFSWTQFHVDAVASLSADSYADFLARSEQAGRTSAAFARHVREVARDRTAFAALGRTPLVVAKELRERLEERGLSVVTYADGREVSMRTWAEMAVRTKTAVAHNVGALGRYSELGVGFVELFDGADCGLERHDDPRKANGLVVSLEEASRYPISHPNCRRAVGARPDVTSAAQARRAEPSTTEAQRADQAESEQAQRRAPAGASRAARAPGAPRARETARAARAAQRAARAVPSAAAPVAPDTVGLPRDSAGVPFLPVDAFLARARTNLVDRNGELDLEYRVKTGADGELDLVTIDHRLGGPVGPSPRTETDLDHVYRVVSAEDYDRMAGQGYLDSAGRNAHRNADGVNVGMVADARLSVSQLTNYSIGTDNVVLRIAVRPGDGWVKDTYDGVPSYVANGGRVPFDRLELRSGRFRVDVDDVDGEDIERLVDLDAR